VARLIVFLAVVALGLGAALVLVSERAALTRTGYRVAELERQRRELIEQNRRLRARTAQLKSAANLLERVRTFELHLVSPEESLKKHLAEAGRRRPGATRRTRRPGATP